MCKQRRYGRESFGNHTETAEIQHSINFLNLIFMLQFSSSSLVSRVMEAVNHSKNSAMEADTFSKHGCSVTIQKGRRSYLFGTLCCLLLALCVGLSSCGDDDDDNGGKGGVLTITGIPAEYNGKYVAVSGWEKGKEYFPNLAGSEKLDGQVEHFTKIVGREAKVNMWNINIESLSLQYKHYTGNDKEVEIEVEVFEEASYDWSKIFMTIEPIRIRTIDGVDFTNGNSTVEWGAEPDGIVGGRWWDWENSWQPHFEFYEDGTWDIWCYVGLAYEGTYTSSGKTVTMTITHVGERGSNEFLGATGVGTVVVYKYKMTVSGFDDVTVGGYGDKILNGEYTYQDN